MRSNQVILEATVKNDASRKHVTSIYALVVGAIENKHVSCLFVVFPFRVGKNWYACKLNVPNSHKVAAPPVCCPLIIVSLTLAMYLHNVFH